VNDEEYRDRRRKRLLGAAQYRWPRKEATVRRYIVVAHKTLGGAHLVEHLRRLRDEDPYCTFHLVVPEHHPNLRAWDDHEVRMAARATLDEMMDRLAMMRIGATGEIGDANPVYAVGNTLRREGRNAFAGIILSTLPKGISRWWLFDVPRRMAAEYPQLPLTHLVAEETLVS
jgi:GABA permease